MKSSVIRGLCLAFFFAIGLCATDYEFYGDVSVTAFWVNASRFADDSIGIVKLEKMAGEFPVYGSDSLDIWENEWLPTGKFGIRFKKERFGACVEFGITKNIFAAKISGSPTTRVLNNKYGIAFEPYKWYMEWYLSELFTLLAGQDYSLINLYNINKILNPQFGYATMGCPYVKGRPMFKLTFLSGNKMVEANIAACKVDTTNIKHVDSTLTKKDKSYIDEIIIPKLEGNVKLFLDKEMVTVKSKLAGGFQTYKIFVHPNVENNVDVTSFIAGGNLSVRVWKFTLSGSAFYGQNLGPYGLVLAEPYAWWRLTGYDYLRMYYPIILEDTLNPMYEAHTFNSKSIEWAISLKIAPWDFVAVEAGYQDIIGEHEYEEFDKRWKDSGNYAWYSNITFKIFEQMSIGIEYGNTAYGKRNGFGEYSYIAANTGLEF